MLPLSKEISRGLLRTLWKIALLFIAAFLLYKIRSVFVYLLLALILTLIGNPIVDFLKSRCKLSKNLSVSLTIIVFLLLFLGFFAMFYPLFSTQLEHLSKGGFAHFENNFEQLAKDIQSTVSSFGLTIDITTSNPMSRFIYEDSLTKLVNTFFTLIGELSVGLGATLFITFFFLKDKAVFQYQFKKHILPDEHTDRIIETLNKIEFLLSRYFIGLSIQLLIFGAICYILLLFVGVKTAIIIALISALLNIVPYIGPLIANVLASLFTLLTFIGDDFSNIALPKAITVCIGYIVIQFLDNNFLQPYIFSNSVKSHPLEIFLVILISGLLGGIFGMIIAVPVYTSLKVILKEFMPENKIVNLFTKDI